MAPNAAPLQEVPSAMQYTQIHTANSRVNNETMLIKDLFRSVVNLLCTRSQVKYCTGGKIFTGILS